MSIASLVVPAISVTMYLCSPIKAFINEDLPAFGRPTTAKRGSSVFISSFSSGKQSINASSKSPVPLPLILATVK